MPNRRMSQFAVPTAIVAIVVMMIVPLPALALDMLIAANITFALFVLLMSMYVKRTLDFSVFPSILLVATLFRLALNVSVTRAVLTEGYAGKVIEAFGHFVIGGSLIVGLVIFTILIVIQFVVITNGAGRVAEVGARFTLDAMPGKQMAIDADLNSGLIDEATARRRRQEVSMEADFYGAMDGGSKFVKGDAIAAIIITLINLLGGMGIGVMQKGMSIGDAVHTYSLLTVGDGLVSQIPALMLSVATGLIVTRASTENDMGTDVLNQFKAQWRAMGVAGAAMLALMMVPGLPKLPFLTLGSTLLFLAWRLKPTNAAEERDASAVPLEPHMDPDSVPALMEEMRVEPIALVVAYDLVDIVDPAVGGDLLGRVKALRRQLALDLGIVLPMVRTRDDLSLASGEYRLMLHGVEVGRGTAPPHRLLAIEGDLSVLAGEETVDPVYGNPGRWITPDSRRLAESVGCLVVERSTVVTTHLREVVTSHAAELLSREDVKALVDMVRATHPTVVEELNPLPLSLGEIQRVLQALLTEPGHERIPVVDLVRIFEALSARARVSTDHDGLIEAARTPLGPAICARYSRRGVLPVLTIDPLFEHDLLKAIRTSEQGAFLSLDGDQITVLGEQLRRLVNEAEERDYFPVLVCSAQLRLPLSRMLRAEFPRLGVLSYTELGGSLQIEAIGVVSGVHAAIA